MSFVCSSFATLYISVFLVVMTFTLYLSIAYVLEWRKPMKDERYIWNLHAAIHFS